MKSSFFIQRPVFAIALAILMVAGGLVAMRGLPIAQFPNIVPPEVLVQATYTGADARTLEQSVATPIEQRVNGVDNMLYLRSTNGNDGMMSLRVTFETGTDPDTNNVLTQNRVNEAAPGLPIDVKNYGVTVKKSMGMPFMVVSVHAGGREEYSSNFLGNYATIHIVDQLARIPGVALVNKGGFSDYALRVWVRPDQLARMNLGVDDIANAIRTQSTVNPAGQVGAEPAPPGQELTYSIRAQGRLERPEEFEKIVIKEAEDGSLVRLRDVARVELGVESYSQKGRMNGEPAALLMLYQTPGSNSLEVAEQVRSTMETLKRDFPSGLDYAISLDTTLPIEAGIEEIEHTLVEALVLVILVVFLFLQSWRATLIPLLTVPVSLIGAFIFFPFLGFSINTVSLFGLVLAIGLVVDDAIVVVEAVEHHIEAGLSPRDATTLAMKQVSGPVIATTLVMAAVFLPAAFMGGIVGQLYQQFAVTVALSVLFSAVNALSLSPALCARLLRPRTHRRGLLQRFFGAFNRGFDRAAGTYERAVRGLLRKLTLGVALFVVCAAAAGFSAKAVPSAFVPEEDQGYLFLNVKLPPPASLQRTDEVCREIERVLAETPGVSAFNTVVGFSLLSGSSAPFNGFFFVQLAPWSERPGRDQHALMIAQQLNQRFAKMPEAEIRAVPPPAIPGIGTGGGFDFMVRAPGTASLADLAAETKKLIGALMQQPEIAGAVTLFDDSVPQVFIDVDREKMLRQGVAPTAVYGSLQAFMGGLYINDFNRFGRQWRVYVSAEPEYRSRVEEIGSFFVRNQDGKMVPLSALSSPRTIVGPDTVVRHNLATSAEILGSGAPGVASGDVLAAIRRTAADTLSSGYSIAWSGMSFQEDRAPSPVPVFVLAIFFVFLILASQYESWALPFSVLLVVPAGIAGAMAALLAVGLAFDVYGQVGMIMLVGLSAKNAILIVEFAKLEREQGASALDAVVKAARLRLRPILMTSFAFILGCVPLLTASGAGARGRLSMGVVVVAGSLAATTLGIFLTPTLYLLVDRLSSALKRGPRAAPPATGPLEQPGGAE